MFQVPQSKTISPTLEPDWAMGSIANLFETLRGSGLITTKGFESRILVLRLTFHEQQVVDEMVRSIATYLDWYILTVTK